MDVWGKLWEIAIGDTASGPARIEVDVEDSGKVTLHWPSGEIGHLLWDNGHWQFVESRGHDPQSFDSA